MQYYLMLVLSLLLSSSSRLLLGERPQHALLHQRRQRDPGPGWWYVPRRSPRGKQGSSSAPGGMDSISAVRLRGLHAGHVCGRPEPRPEASGRAAERGGSQCLLHAWDPPALQHRALFTRRPLPRRLEPPHMWLHRHRIPGAQLWNWWGWRGFRVEGRETKGIWSIVPHCTVCDLSRNE